MLVYVEMCWPVRRPGQQVEHQVELVPGVDDTLHAHDGDVDRGGDRGAEAAVALVLDQHDRAGLGHAEVAARHAHVGGEEPRPQLFASEGGKVLGHVVEHAVGPGDGLEDVADLVPVEVHGRGDDVARRLVGQLDDPLAEVGLDDVDASASRASLSADLLGGHRLALHDRRGHRARGRGR